METQVEKICGNCAYYSGTFGNCGKTRLVDGYYWTPQGFVSRVPMRVIPEFACMKFQLDEAISAGTRPTVTAEFQCKPDHAHEFSTAASISTPAPVESDHG